MEDGKKRREVKHAFTPSSRINKDNIDIFKLGSPEKRLKKKQASNHKPTLSDQKVLTIVRVPRSNPSSKSSTPKNARVNKSTNHRRFVSSGDRPNSSSGTKKPQNSNTRKFSMDPSYLAPAVCKYSYLSKTGYIPGNTPKTNQDNYFAHINFANQQDMYLFGVCDGHGFYGGEVSGFIKQRLPVLLAQDRDILSNPNKSLTSCIHRCNLELSQINLDVKFSGSTLVVVLIKGNTLYCANVGDSRAFLGRQILDKTDKSISGRKWMSIALSRDHKPDSKDESERIYKSGGRVEAYQDENGNPAGPARVWLKNQDIPGLAMSRSLGDGVAASVGVICDPEILEIKLVPEDKFIIIASDGVFEFISNEEIVRIVVPYYRVQDCEGTCDAIVREANKRWKREEEVIDDITAVCIFLDIPH
ncbi:hypothetical protein SteCoe_30657 [Stentor coeruleus]|uniref:PPM-type phosphatase domain-containing protein n=1 Tax=Stentor coeruleus TaxID=5963 RepID=A0A1R2B349_9CILI|nr:hypothetical protein SteCoe_30657 [Stentor coeruleus]